MKIVVNRCFGGFGLSDKAKLFLDEIWNQYDDDCASNRDHPKLVEVVEKLGVEANGKNAELQVIEIPDDIDWVISNYDGIETIEERHRS